MKKKVSALLALVLSGVMILTACSGGGSTTATTAAATTAAAAETQAAQGEAAAPSGETVNMIMGTGGTTGTYYAFGGVIANVLNSKNVGVTLRYSPQVRRRQPFSL